MTKITRHFVTVGSRQVHYRRAGSGPPVVLLHPSPNSSASMAPFMRALAPNFTAIALDTPSYGLSDPLAVEEPEIADLGQALADTLDALGIERCGLLASHTGASIAIEFVRANPARTTLAVFDGYPAYTEQRRADMLEFYLDPYVPVWDGSHLLHTWMKFREQFMFWPMYRKHKENRANAVPRDALATQDGVLQRLIAGEDYDVAYSAVFRYDAIAAAHDVRAPVCFAAREGDSLIHALDLLGELPDGCWTARMPRDLEAAAEAYADIFVERRVDGVTPPAPDAAPIAGRVSRSYIGIGGSQLMVYRAGGGKARALVMVPHAPGGADMLEPLMMGLAETRPVIAFDLPGNGDSDAVGSAGPSIEGYTDALAELIDALDLGSFDLYGHNAGASVALEYARRNPGAGKLVLDGVMCLDEPARLALAPAYAPPIQPKWDGSHLIGLWHALRNEQLFWPWYSETLESVRVIEPQIDPRHLSKKIVGILKQYRNYDAVWRAAFAYPTRAKLANLEPGAMICAAEHDVFARFAEAAAALAPGAESAPLPGEAKDAAAVIARFLDA